MVSDNDRADVIRKAFEGAGLEPVAFEKPLKSVGSLVRLKKIFRPESLLDRHAAVGWAMGTLTDRFEKEMWQIRRLQVVNEHHTITIEAEVYITGLTFEDDHEAYLDGIVANMAGEDTKAWGYFYYRPPHYHWDSAERIGDVTGFTQMAGDGKATGTLGDGEDKNVPE